MLCVGKGAWWKGLACLLTVLVANVAGQDVAVNHPIVAFAPISSECPFANSSYYCGVMAGLSKSRFEINEVCSFMLRPSRS
jgi:hypothetical protein